ncbi:MAG: hypothetical protein KatS3mg087_1790 [Patescibacteria group bacterium]|nr:MAG: hypothetical protein KatS3mg087_1790 [Patescibacteria group bacterium]
MGRSRRQDLVELARQKRLLYLRQLARDYRHLALRLRDAYQVFLRELDNAAGVDIDVDKVRDSYLVFLDTLSDIAPQVQKLGVQAGVQNGVSWLDTLSGVDVRWSQMTVEAIESTLSYLDKLPNVVNKFESYHMQQVQSIILAAQNEGINPRQVALMIKDYFTKSQNPLADAERFTRTLQIYSARQGARAIYERNGVEQWIWSANIGSRRTCMACIVRHGTVHPITEVLNDHFNGRCSAIPVIKNAQLSYQFEDGISWFMRQDEDTQRYFLGAKFHDAWQQGKIRVDQSLVGTYQNTLFGQMIRRKTLGELLNNE